jgi:5-formyltetrahydrofolate cyclo-ligase
LLSNPEKTALRKMLLEKRDSTSFDLIQIHSEKIYSRLKKIKSFVDANSIGCYYSIGSEVQTKSIILDLLNQKKHVSLPKMVNDIIVFRAIKNFNKLEKGNFGILEPRDDWPEEKSFDVILVPAIGLTKNGVRLGYGHGYYDKFLADKSVTKIALTYNKQIIKSIPASEHDIKMDWIISESESILISE